MHVMNLMLENCVTQLQSWGLFTRKGKPDKGIQAHSGVWIVGMKNLNDASDQTVSKHNVHGELWLMTPRN